MPHIAIIGLGQIGSSLGMALRQAKLGYDVVGHDREPEVAGKARKLGAVDRTEWNLPAAVRDAALVIVAVPLYVLPEVLTIIAPHLAEGTVVTDTCSVKVEVLRRAGEILPNGVSFVGGHPLPRAEMPGVENAAADLFATRPYCLVPAPGVEAQAIELVADLAKAVGARPFFLDAAEHDSFAAALHHLPPLLAAVLLDLVRSDPAWNGLAGLGSEGLWQSTRAVACHPADQPAICRANREAILRWLDGYRARLTRLRAAIDAGDLDGVALEDMFRRAERTREELVHGAGKAEATPIVTTGERLRKMLTGGRKGWKR